MCDRLDELTRNEIMPSVESKVKKRAAKLNAPRYIGITKDYIVHMRVDSSTGKGSYIVRIKLDEYPDIADIEDMTTGEKVRLSLAGDMKIHCNCPAFKWWGYEYITTQLDSNSHSVQDIYPSIRNPKLEGVICKHCYKAFSVFGRNWTRIAKDIAQHHFID